MWNLFDKDYAKKTKFKFYIMLDNFDLLVYTPQLTILHVKNKQNCKIKMNVIIHWILLKINPFF